MEKKAPSLVQIGVIAGFVLSCFAIGLYLWIVFGGPTPLAGQPYQVKVPFEEATQLADEADVRISGVSIGKVSSVDLPPDGSVTMATISVDPEYAPLPSDIRATLRAKTILGETYVELTPGSADSPSLAEGAILPRGRVHESVQLDEILRTLDEPTRQAFRTWMQDSSVAITGRGPSLSASLQHFPDTFAGFEQIFRTLDTQEHAVDQLFADGSETFAALSERRGQLRSLIQSSNAVLKTTAARDQEIIDTFRVFPTFLNESRLTFARLREFSLNADPLMQQLVPVAQELSPTLIEFGELAPELKGFFDGLEPVIANADKAFPAFRKLFRDDFPPLLRDLEPFLTNLNPILEVIRAYRHELTGLIGNASAMTQATSAANLRTETVDGIEVQVGDDVHYLRTLSPLGPESLATFPGRLKTNRANPYTKPGAYAGLASGLEVFGDQNCSGGLSANLDPASPANPAFSARVNGDAEEAEDFFSRLRLYAFGDSLSSDGVPAPGCRQQGPFDAFGAQGDRTQYPHTLQARP